MERDSFIFYRSFYEAIQDLDDSSKLQLFNAICETSLNDEKPELQGMAKTLFKVIEPQLRANNDRYLNGKKGGRPKKETIGYENKKANKNENENENVNENDIWLMQFEKFYQKYPKKVAKQKVLKWFEKNKPSSELFSTMLTSLEQFRGTKEWKKDNGQYIPYPSTWLNQKRWEDDTIGNKTETIDIAEYKTISADDLTEEEYRKLMRGGSNV